MENSIQLRADGQQIEINISNPAWCKCWLQAGANSIYLGAEGLAYIQSHLLNGLKSDPNKINGHLNRKNVRWILSLAEVHCTLYITNSDEAKTLFWQDKHGHIISEINLPAKEMKQWIIQLEAMNYNSKDNA